MESSPPSGPKLRWALGLGVVAFVALRVVAVHTTAANWDEFGLFEMSSRTAETGELIAGGRPGLAQLLVLPWVAGCESEMAVLQRARLVWVGITLAFLVGLGALVAQLQSDPRRRVGDGLLAVGLLALVPEFLEWSIQVRTDQIALAGACWGGVALLASRRRPWLSLVAGALFGVGFLSSQKLVYVVALIGVLVVAQHWLLGELRVGREAARASLCAATFALCFAAFQVVAHASGVETEHTSLTELSQATVRSSFDAFDFYRKTIGYSQYVAMLGSLVPHFLLLVALIVATFTSRDAAKRLWTAWAVIALGVAVGAFHAAAFAYFWMTLGLFPAVAFALARESLVGLLPASRRVRAVAFAGFWILLAGPGVEQMIWMLEDTQSVQRESLGFVQRNFQSDDAGFQPESALFCRGDAQPIRHFYSSTIYQNFGRPGTEHMREQIVQRFDDEDVKFLVESFRLNQFPVEVRRFWAENYQPYHGSVFVAGRRLAGPAGAESAFRLVAPGAYRWLPFEGPQPLWVDGRALAPGEVVELSDGEHVARFTENIPGGMLVLALNEPPTRAPLAFYKTY